MLPQSQHANTGFRTDLWKRSALSRSTLSQILNQHIIKTTSHRAYRTTRINTSQMLTSINFSSIPASIIHVGNILIMTGNVPKRSESSSRFRVGHSGKVSSDSGRVCTRTFGRITHYNHTPTACSAPACSRQLVSSIAHP